MTLLPLDEEGDFLFLQTVRDELDNLKKRLKHEIIQKLQLIKQIKELKNAKSQPGERVDAETQTSVAKGNLSIENLLLSQTSPILLGQSA